MVEWEVTVVQKRSGNDGILSRGPAAWNESWFMSLAGEVLQRVGVEAIGCRSGS